MNQVSLFQVLGHKRQILVQIFNSLLELGVSRLRVSYLHNVKVIFCINEFAKDKLLGKERLKTLCHCCRVKEGLSALLLDLLKLLENESEVFLDGRVCQHSVCLVKNKELQVAQVLLEAKLIMFQVVNYATGSSNHDVWNIT